MKNGSEYHYPSSDAYTEKLYSDESLHRKNVIGITC